MKLFTKDILNKLPALQETAQLSSEEITVPLKLFGGSCTWYIYEYDPETGIGMCFANLGNPVFAELGSVSVPEIKEALGFMLQRDRHFKPMILSEIIEIVENGGHV
jgi:hypothetical protein